MLIYSLQISRGLGPWPAAANGRPTRLKRTREATIFSLSACERLRFVRLCSRSALRICRLHYRAASLWGAITAVDVIVIAGLCGERTHTRHTYPLNVHMFVICSPRRSLLSLNGRPGFRTR
jgi:hypothetical protein